MAQTSKWKHDNVKLTIDLHSVMSNGDQSHFYLLLKLHYVTLHINNTGPTTNSFVTTNILTMNKNHVLVIQIHSY